MLVNEFLQMKVLKEPRKSKKRINSQGKITYKLTKKPMGTTCISEMEDFGVFCLEKRQQSS